LTFPAHIRKGDVMYPVYKDGYFVYNCSSAIAARIIADRIGGEVEPDDDEYLELSEIVGAYSVAYE